MDILLLDSLVPEALNWLQSRHDVEYLPELVEDPRALRTAVAQARAIVLPRKIAVTREFLEHAPALKAIARLHVGTDNTDLEACQIRGVAVLQASRANVRSNAEYLLGGLLMLMRRGMAAALKGDRHAIMRLGREMQGSTIGLLGMSPTAHSLSGLLTAMGARLVGYDPAIHYSSPIWERLQVKPVSLPELMSSADAISVQMLFASRYRGFINQQTLLNCRPRQLWVATSRSALFDVQALAAALTDGRIEACLLDGAETGFASKGSPLHALDNLYLTPRLGSNTREARTRASWYVAHRIHETLQPRANGEAGFAESGPQEQHGTPSELPVWSAEPVLNRAPA